MRPLNNTPQFDSPNRFDALRMTTDGNEKKSDEQLDQSEIDSNSPKINQKKLKPQQQLSLVTRL